MTGVTQKIAYDKLTDKDVRDFFQDMAKHNPAKHISDIKGTVFSYPTVTYSTWDSMKMPHLENGKKTTLTIDTINFKFKGYNMRHPLYHAGFVYYDNNPVLNKVPTDKLLANYVLPSVQNLNELNQYSRIENLKRCTIPRTKKTPYTKVKKRAPSTKILDTIKRGT